MASQWRWPVAPWQHSVIQANLIAATAPKLRGSGCRPFTSDMLVRTDTGRGRYPDMTIGCGPLRGEDRAAPNPRVVFEVLSENTQRADRTIKLADHNASPSIAHYVLIEPNEPAVDVYSRGAHGDFNAHPVELRGLEGLVELPAIRIVLAISDIYNEIALDNLQGDAKV